MTDLRIAPGNFSDPRVIDLLKVHVALARAETAPGSDHALDPTGLQDPSIRFWTIWHDHDLLGLGALKQLSPTHGEVKSMHTIEDRRRTGAGSAMLRHIIAAARAEGFSRLSLETGSWAYFEPARAFYRSHGFAHCPPFDAYTLDPNSVFMTMLLSNP